MFDLDSAIKNWRNGFQASAVDSDSATELEAHLRDLFRDIKSLGLADQEAFLVATHRLGDTAALDGEFAKVNPSAIWRNRIVWMLGGYIAYRIGTALIGLMSAAASTGVAVTGWGATATGVTSSLCLALGWTTLLVLAYRQSKKPWNGPFRVPIALGVIIGLVVVFGGLAQMFGTRIQIRALGVAEFGQSVLLLSYTNWAVSFFVFVAAVGMVCTLRARDREECLA